MSWPTESQKITYYTHYTHYLKKGLFRSAFYHPLPTIKPGRNPLADRSAEIIDMSLNFVVVLWLYRFEEVYPDGKEFHWTG